MLKPPTRTANTVFVIVITTLFTIWYALRVYSSLVNWPVLVEYGANPWYILISGLVWLLGGIGLLTLLWKKHPFTIRAGLGLAGLYTVWYWCDRLFVQLTPAPNLLFSAVFSAILLTIFIFILATASS